MANRSGWKVLQPNEQLTSVIRVVNKLVRERNLYTRIQGIRLESRLVAGERRLYAVVVDETASNFGSEYQLAP